MSLTRLGVATAQALARSRCASVLCTMLFGVLLISIPLPAFASSGCAQRIGAPDYAEDWLFVEQVGESRESVDLGSVEARLRTLIESAPEEPWQRSERVALRVALLDAKATLEWIAAREAGTADFPEFEWQYRALHPHRAEQLQLLREALNEDPGHPLLVKSLLSLEGGGELADPGLVRQQLELAIARSPDEGVLAEHLVYGLLGRWADFDAAVTRLPAALRASPSCPETPTVPWNTAASQLMLVAVDAVVRETRPCWWPLRDRVLSRARGQLRSEPHLSVAGIPDDQIASALRDHFIRNEQPLAGFIESMAEDFERAECAAAPEAPEVRWHSPLPDLVELVVQHCEYCTVLVEDPELGDASPAAVAAAAALVRSREPRRSRLWLRATPETSRPWQVFAARRVDPRGVHPPPPWPPSAAVVVDVETAPAFTQAPEPPLRLSAEDLNPYAIRLRWDAADGWAYGFELQECVEREPESCRRTALISFDQRELEYTHAAPAGKRRYELRAFNPVGVSAPVVLHWTAGPDPELEQLHEAWRQRQPERQTEAVASASRPSAVLALASHLPALPSEPWRLYEAIDDLPEPLRPDPGAGGLWRPIESSKWAQRCTSREELVSLPLETFDFRLEWQGRVRLEDGGEVDVFWITDHDTQCDFNACPAWVAFGVLPGAECYVHRGWALPVPPDLEPALGTGWERGTAGEQAFVWCNQRGRVHAFTTCRLSENALPSLRPPLVERWGHALEACQAWPLARE